MVKHAPSFSIIVVNFNGGAYLQVALDSLSAQSIQDFEVILVDNNSDDSSLKNLDTSRISDIRVLAESENHGFAKACNIAARSARAGWLVLLNPDAVADPDWLQRISEGIGKFEHTNVFACTQLSLDRPDLLDGAGDAYWGFGLPWRGGFQRPVEELPEAGFCFSPCGASAIYKRDVFLDFGGFDERYFCYCEDVDLGYRMQLGGENCVFLPKAIVRHKGGGISGQNSYFTLFHGNRNRTWTYLKNTPLFLLFMTLPVHVAFLAYSYMRNRKKLPNKGMRDGIFAGFREGWKLRREDKFRTRRKQISTLSLMSKMAWNPYRMIQNRTDVRSIKA